MTFHTNPRSCILQVGAKAGHLCGAILIHDDDGSSSRADLMTSMADLLKELYLTSFSLNLHLVTSIQSKLDLNRRKYPVELCKVRGWFWAVGNTIVSKRDALFINVLKLVCDM